MSLDMHRGYVWAWQEAFRRYAGPHQQTMLALVPDTKKAGMGGDPRRLLSGTAPPGRSRRQAVRTTDMIA